MANRRTLLLSLPVTITVVTLLGVAGANTLVRAQGKPRPSGGTITGRVVAADTEAPVRRVRVRLSAVPASTLPSPRETDTDENGGFEFSGLPAGRYFAMAMPVGGYVAPPTMASVDLSPEGTAVITIRLERAAAIVGRVVDESGQTVARARVQAVPVTWVRFGKRASGGAQSTGIAWTDDRGQYRLFDVAAGEYYVGATYTPPSATAGSAPVGPAGPRTGYRTTYHPSAAAVAEARAVVVSPGEERAGVDISLVPAPVARVSVVAMDSSGQPLPQIAGPTSVVVSNVLLVSKTDPFATFPMSVRPTGGFSASGVPLGEYYLAATLYGPASSGAMRSSEAAWVPVSVTGDISDLPVRTNAGARIRGRIVWDAASAVTRRGEVPLIALDVASMSAYAQPAGDPAFLGSVFTYGQRAGATRDGAFELTGVRGPTRFQTIGGTVFVGARRGGRDITGQVIDILGDERIDDLELVVTRRSADIRGTSPVDAATGRNGAWVIAFPENPAMCYTGSPFVSFTSLLGPFPPANEPPPAAGVGRTSKPDRAPFYLGNLAPGRYALAVVSRSGDRPDLGPPTLERLRAGATVLTLAPGQTASVDLPNK
jgi:hypothetical protein